MRLRNPVFAYSGHSTNYQANRIAQEDGVWVRAYRTWACGKRRVRYDVLTGSATWLGCTREYADQVLRTMCQLSADDARQKRFRAFARMEERARGCAR